MTATPTAAIATALHAFRKTLFEHVANPNKTDLDTVENAWKTWETECVKYEHRCNQQTTHYLEVHHGDRLTYETNYAEYRQSLQFARQAAEEATLGEFHKTTEAYLKACIKPPTVLQRPSQIYTAMLYNPPKLAIPESKAKPEEEEEEAEEDYEAEDEEDEEEEAEEEYEEEEEEDE
jgi:hypothetical protein